MDVTTSILIGRPIAKVPHFAADPDNAPRWYENIESVEWETPRPLVVGSRMAFVVRFLGKRMEYTYEVVELIPLERLVMRMADGPDCTRPPNYRNTSDQADSCNQAEPGDDAGRVSRLLA